MLTEQEFFRNFLLRKGMRLTPERETILAEVFARHDHFDVDELFMRLRNNNQRISKASLYRTMALLVESEMVQEVYFEDGHLHYEHVYGHDHHCHLRCLGCRTIIEFTDAVVGEVEKRICAANGFETIGHKLEIRGYCSQCQRKGSRR
jgi:Fur family transcriptional regulator, ferric uptake regulator